MDENAPRVRYERLGACIALAGLLWLCGLDVAPSGRPGTTWWPVSTAAASGTPSEAEARSIRAAAWFEAHRDRPPMLRAFLQRMPKGGDIHTHLSGAVYAESYLEWAAVNHLEGGKEFCVDTQNDHLVYCDVEAYCVVRADDARPDRDESRYCEGEGDPRTPAMPAARLLDDSARFAALVDRLSTRNLDYAGQSGHDQFFAAFAGFGAVSSERTGDMLARVADRAAAQHVAYLEVMITFQGGAVRALGKEVGWDGDLEGTRGRLLDRGLRDLVAEGRADAAALTDEHRKLLDCGRARARPGCGVTVRYLQQTTRTKPPAEVYAQLVYAFELADAEPRVVGVNLVAPEDDPRALRDYSLQMGMLEYLHGKYPRVNVALHAGELTMGLVPLRDLRFHIREAVERGHAKRIGHGVDLFYEDAPFALMQTMRERGVLVEICLTSNDVILGVRGDAHPFMSYLRAGVPVTLASDDEGVSRIDLTHEYHRAALTYDLGYRELKTLSRNSLQHSFLAGDPLWQAPGPAELAAPCAGDEPGSETVSEACREFLDASDRARLQWELEAAFAAFEREPWLERR